MKTYQSIFDEIKKTLTNESTNDTPTITKLIKEYFCQSYPSNHVAGSVGKAEFLFDIAVLSCNPEDIKNDSGESYCLHVAVESELGGTSGSRSKKVEENIFFDFTKLLFANATQKILIGAYSIPSRPPSTKIAEISRLKDKFQSINNKSSNTTDTLIILLMGDHTSGNSRQIKIKLPIEIDGFILSKNGQTKSC